MPDIVDNRAARYCSYPGCTTLVRSGRCEKHAWKAPTEDDRPSPCKRGYGRPWQRERRAFLMQPENVICADCGRKATEVHHIEPVKAGGSSEASNLVALCKRCHTRREKRHGHA